MSPSTARYHRTQRYKRSLKRRMIKNHAWLVLLLLTIALSLFFARQNPEPLFSVRASVAQEVELVSPLPVRESEVSPTPSPSPTPTPVPTKCNEKCQIVKYITEKFGDRAADAIVIIRTCENSTFDQSRTNHNNNGTVDYGVFQVNSIHEKRYGGAFKTDWKANVDVAYEIYKSAGEKFTPWTCAHKIGEKNYLGQ